jgi:hypothetical protein
MRWTTEMRKPKASLPAKETHMAGERKLMLKINTEKGPREVVAMPMNLDVGGVKVRFFVAEYRGSVSLSHRASGQKVCDLGDHKLRRFVGDGHTHLTNREAAKEKLALIIAEYGAEEVRRRFNAVPVINP